MFAEKCEQVFRRTHETRQVMSKRLSKPLVTLVCILHIKNESRAFTPIPLASKRNSLKWVDEHYFTYGELSTIKRRILLVANKVVHCVVLKGNRWRTGIFTLLRPNWADTWNRNWNEVIATLIYGLWFLSFDFIKLFRAVTTFGVMVK